MSVNSNLKATGQRKAFYMQRTLECSCTRKETADTDIFVTYRMVTKNHAIYQNNE